VISGWELMAFCASTFPPEESLQKPLVGLLLEIVHESAPREHEVQFAEWAQRCLDLLRKSFLFGDRRLLPSFQELEAIKVSLFSLFFLSISWALRFFSFSFPFLFLLPLSIPFPLAFALALALALAITFLSRLC
jgi:hypothetical protein